MRLIAGHVRLHVAVPDGPFEVVNLPSGGQKLNLRLFLNIQRDTHVTNVAANSKTVPFCDQWSVSAHLQNVPLVEEVFHDKDVLFERPASAGVVERNAIDAEHFWQGGRRLKTRQTWKRFGKILLAIKEAHNVLFRAGMSNPNGLLSQELCHYLNQGRTLNGLLWS